MEERNLLPKPCSVCSRMQCDCKRKKRATRHDMHNKLYNSTEWKEFRDGWLWEYPYCAHCGRPGNEVHHLRRHNYVPALFFDVGEGKTITLCKSCHSIETAAGR